MLLEAKPHDRSNLSVDLLASLWLVWVRNLQLVPDPDCRS